ncbi:glycosyltransferase family 2 protein [Aliiroseovarius halocynthiae]|uniref:Glycosyltransferase family 2 protein n=2 Tax=Aliiroseovarius halocynthiae TaxID=985055 RepID=A0A545SQF4_9RHOB|nr:glycosyltransferase family 2 protein [Aliiroseovarius halocynthiae]
MRNEGPHLLEWIAHHRALGVDEFLIFTNDCEDGTGQMLDILAGEGWLHHIRHDVPANKSVQWQALKQARTHPAYQVADWVMVIDCDEFVNLAEPLSDLRELVEAMPDKTDAIMLPWRLFGNNRQRVMGGGLTLEAFTQAAPLALRANWHCFFKTLYRRTAFGRPGVHRPKPRAQGRMANWVTASGESVPEADEGAEHMILKVGEPHAGSLVQLNHYSLRSVEDFLVKINRGLPNRRSKEIGLGYWVERNFNTLEERSIQRFLPGLKTCRAGFARGDELQDLHRMAVRHHRQVAQNAIQKEDMFRLVWQLSLAGNSGE